MTNSQADVSKLNNWVRNFHSSENGGGHKWSPVKTQVIYSDAFRCLNWSKCNEEEYQCGEIPNSNLKGFSCTHVDNPNHPNCLAKNIPYDKAFTVLNYLSLNELRGIPNIKLDNLLKKYKSTCSVNPYDQRVSSTNSFSDYLSSRKIFSEELVNCAPIGTKMFPHSSEHLCCTGNIINGKCSLPAGADLSLYFNKKVSSEALPYVKDNHFDKKS